MISLFINYFGRNVDDCWVPQFHKNIPFANAHENHAGIETGWMDIKFIGSAYLVNLRCRSIKSIVLFQLFFTFSIKLYYCANQKKAHSTMPAVISVVSYTFPKKKIRLKVITGFT